MMTVRNEIKAQIVRAGYTMQEVVDRLHEEYGWSDSVSNLSAKSTKYGRQNPITERWNSDEQLCIHVFGVLHEHPPLSQAAHSFNARY